MNEQMNKNDFYDSGVFSFILSWYGKDGGDA